ncbi:hypothetical protein Vau01_027700 [Virgisporangium aurantiacum]|uniref:TM2 domain-containing protein n=2 Tax=Virgisporangium aurantiacum TaxID=175570 RepID=A0A8J4DYS9_9ACTN|nr:hypothetical protein Vau01_027700 [Virgisporangium aurantiacum]
MIKRCAGGGTIDNPLLLGCAAVSMYPPAGGGYAGQVSDKSKLVAGLLGILLGGFGAGRFYTGHTGMAIGQIAATWLTCGLGGLWPLIDGIMILVKGGTDAQGRILRDQ